LPKIFDLFVTTKPPGKGTGLELAISQEIIKAHGGTLKVSSQVGNGMTVQIFLPTDAKWENELYAKHRRDFLHIIKLLIHLQLWYSSRLPRKATSDLL
jgi:Histidine kinase-, DNA gyrase B-, and HSP90-like ATPase